MEECGEKKTREGTRGGGGSVKTNEAEVRKSQVGNYSLVAAHSFHIFHSFCNTATLFTFCFDQAELLNKPGFHFFFAFFFSSEVGVVLMIDGAPKFERYRVWCSI